MTNYRIPGLLLGQEEEEAEEEDHEIETWLQLPRLKSWQLGQAYHQPFSELTN